MPFSTPWARSRYILYGISESGPMALYYTAMYPDRVRALILFGTLSHFDRDVISQSKFAGRTWAGQVLERGLDAFLNDLAAKSGQGIVYQDFLSHPPDREAEQRVLARYERSACTPQMCSEIMRRNFEIDVTPFLPVSSVPTLVMHCDRDPILPVEAGREIAKKISGARYVEIDGDFHGSWRREDMDKLRPPLTEFILEVFGESQSSPDEIGDRELATVLLRRGRREGRRRQQGAEPAGTGRGKSAAMGLLERRGFSFNGGSEWPLSRLARPAPSKDRPRRDSCARQGWGCTPLRVVILWLTASFLCANACEAAPGGYVGFIGSWSGCLPRSNVMWRTRRRRAAGVLFLVAGLAVAGLAASGVAQADSQPLLIDVTAVQISGSFLLDGGPFPTDSPPLYAKDADLSLLPDVGQAVLLGSSETGTYGSLPIVAGTYTRLYEAKSLSGVGTIPENAIALVGSTLSLVGGATTVDVDVPSVDITLEFTVDGGVPTLDPWDSARIDLRHVATGDRVRAGYVQDGSATLRVLSGVYDVVYEHVDGTTLPQNTQAVLASDLVLSTSQTVPVDVPTATPVFSYLLNGQPFTNSFPSDGSFGLHDFATGDFVALGDSDAGPVALTVVAGRYDATWAGNSSWRVSPQNSNAIVGTDLDVIGSAEFVLSTLR